MTLATATSSLVLAALLCSVCWACRISETASSDKAIESNPTALWITGWSKPATNPVLQADSTYRFTDPRTGMEVAWQRADVFNPGAVTAGDSVYLLFRAEDNPDVGLGYRTSRVGLAASADGLNFVRDAIPVLYPDEDSMADYEWPGGCEDPRVIHHPEGGFLMYYTAWNQDVARLSAARSPDLRSWTKHGPVFESAYGGRFHDTWTKSGSVVCSVNARGELIATKLDGRYWMYWGDAIVGIAHSENLLDWTPVLNPDGSLYDPLPRRAGHFDSGLSEPGPPAILTDAGILVMYNGKNSALDSLRDSSISAATYCVGQALFDATDPTRLLQRQPEPFLYPTLAHERSGQYAAGTTFAEGLVRFKGKWFLYYGTADSMVGVAVSDG